MDALQRCRECYTLFRFADEAELDGRPLEFCPGCGAYEDVFDEVPDHFELSWYWELIQAVFSIRERVMLKAVADRSIEFPGI